MAGSIVCLYLLRALSFLSAGSKNRSKEGGRSSTANSPVLRVMDVPLTPPEELSESPYRVERNAAEDVTPNHAPKCTGSMTRGANSIRETLKGVSIGVNVAVAIPDSARCTAPAKLSNEKYSGIFRQGDCSTEPNLACGKLRSVTLEAGMAGIAGVAATGRVRKLLSLIPAKLRLNPRKLSVRKIALRTSELIASPKLSENARRKVSEES